MRRRTRGCRAQRCPTPARSWMAALAQAGWEELADERMMALVGPACAALGRGFAPLAPVDALLGGALQSGDLARYAEPSSRRRAARGPPRRPPRVRRGGQARRASLHGRPGHRPRGGGPAARRPRRPRGGAANAGLGCRIDRLSRRARPGGAPASRSNTRGRGSPSESRCPPWSRSSRCWPMPRR